jgi:hypothetical protein
MLIRPMLITAFISSSARPAGYIASRETSDNVTDTVCGFVLFISHIVRLSDSKISIHTRNRPKRNSVGLAVNAANCSHGCEKAWHRTDITRHTV